MKKRLLTFPLSPQVFLKQEKIKIPTDKIAEHFIRILGIKPVKTESNILVFYLPINSNEMVTTMLRYYTNSMCQHLFKAFKIPEIQCKTLQTFEFRKILMFFGRFA